MRLDMLDEKKIKSFAKDVDCRIKELGAARDKISDMLEEIHGLEDVCERAYEALEDARASLSELV